LPRDTGLAAADAAQWPDYKLSADIDPATHRLSGVAEVTLPAAMAGQSVEFVLAANFSITASNRTRRCSSCRVTLAAGFLPASTARAKNWPTAAA
jgi:ferredoxin